MAQWKKKICWHTTFGKVEVEETQYRAGTQGRRPFVESAGVKPRGCSQPLQRVVTDFGADHSFEQAVHKLKEHYGVTLPDSTARRITEGHAEAILEQMELEEAWPEQDGREIIVAEMDGGMVPVVEPDATQDDRRKGKRLFWKEAKISMAHALGSTTPYYGGTLEGGPDAAGRHLYHCAVSAGFGANTHVHAVGDGAPWLADQVEQRFGEHGSYLLDFYHVCDYLAAASKGCDPNPAAWLEIQKTKLKANRADEVLAALAVHLEPATVGDKDAPVRGCHRYLSNRRHQLDYQGAKQRGCPIGSGEIESSHRYVVQKRLKLPGAWWLPRNAQAMLALRLLRANQQWETYWQGCIRQAA